MIQQQIGLIGLAVMGENLALNIERQGFSVAVYNRSREKTDAFMAKRAQDKNIQGTYSIADFVNAVERPRKILLMVQAGKPVDAVISQLQPLLEAGDTIIDGGNSLYEETARRSCDLENAGLKYIGMGVSGGEIGALLGPSLMPGGNKTAYEELAPILTKIAAQVADGACVTYLGLEGAGHYVKMVHNGIEYGDMQLIAEVYDLLKHALGFDHQQLHDIFNEWNTTEELNSYLIEATADIFQRIDPETHHPIVELISDAAEQKGTGRWTVMSALELGIYLPTITAAVEVRSLSAAKQERVETAKLLKTSIEPYDGDIPVLVNKIRDALYCSKICAYAQGMSLLKAASDRYNYAFNLSEIARIWKGGCIIRAKLLESIQTAYQQNPDLPNLLVAPEFKQAILDRQQAWREVVSVAAQVGIPTPALSASLHYFDGYRHDRLPQNLTQAQRDYFGAHTYERVDKPGVFHTEWTPIDAASLQTS